MDIIQVLREAVRRGASDVHVTVARPVTFRLHGRLVAIDENLLTPKDTEEFMKSITSEDHRAQIERIGGVDFGFNLERGVRFRSSVFKQRGSYGIVLRLLPTEFFTFEKIGLPAHIIELLSRPRGLILVTGPTGSGKTTTLATMINYINENHDVHVITIEDPIEYNHDHKKSIVNQREVGSDVPSFSEALVKALRQDPDVILIGEMRDLATMESAITAAETGHLVFATLHTTGAARTVDRIIDVFPAHQQPQVRTQLASTLIAVISQTLIPRVDVTGRVAAFEIMISTPAIANLIREGKTHQIVSELQTGAKYGSKSMDKHLLELYSRGIISYDEALAKSYDPGLFAHEASRIGVAPKGTVPKDPIKKSRVFVK
ncbi:MAG: type IV pili twitching motility protein PilT [Omnitrophica bacterium RIFCSPLOWO2_12_FULL_50_11]|nr:MAG: type IV pili twitching motility protein PilT [Omnitrophica bacterium RIFCSPLOWO2_12_FULL_50_11]